MKVTWPFWDNQSTLPHAIFLGVNNSKIEHLPWIILFCNENN